MKKKLCVFLTVVFSTFMATTALAAIFFDSQQAIETSFKATTATAYDFNNDGKTDLITGDQSTGTISILLGNGDGTFQKLSENAFDSISFVAGDFNHDGKTDLAVFNADSYYWFSMYLGNGDGTFQDMGYYKDWSGNGLSTFTAGDFNDDGITDIVTVSAWRYRPLFSVNSHKGFILNGLQGS